MTSPAISRLSKALNAATHDGDVKELLALAEWAGVNGRLARRAARGIDINAGAYLKLCAALAIDPVTGSMATDEALAARAPLPDLDWHRVAIKILLVKIAGASLRKLSKKWKVEYTAINRAKHGQPVGVDNFLKICAGLQAHPHAFLRPIPKSVGPTVKRETCEVVT